MLSIKQSIMTISEFNPNDKFIFEDGTVVFMHVSLAGSSGARYEILKPPRASRQMINELKKYLVNQMDAVTIRVINGT